MQDDQETVGVFGNIVDVGMICVEKKTSKVWQIRPVVQMLNWEKCCHSNILEKAEVMFSYKTHHKTYRCYNNIHNLSHTIHVYYFVMQYDQESIKFFMLCSMFNILIHIFPCFWHTCSQFLEISSVTKITCLCRIHVSKRLLIVFYYSKLRL